MRTRINNITFTPGTRSINTGIADLTVDDIRLFINESQMKVICSTMLKSNIDSIVSGVVTYKNIFPVLASGDHITFEVDLGDNAAKEATSLEILSELDNVAQEATLGDVAAVLDYIEQGGMPEIENIAKQGTNQNATNTAILQAVENINIDTSDLAKQGTNPNATLSEVQAKIGTPASGQAATLFGAIGDVALSAQTLQSLADSWAAMVTDRTTLGGYTFVDDSSAQNIGEVLARGNLVKRIDDDNVTLITHAYSGFSSLQSVKLQNLETISVGSAFASLPIQSVQFPSLKTVTTSDAFYRCQSLTSIYVPNLEYLFGAFLQSCSAIENVDFPSLITIAGANEFYGCSNLKRLSMPNVSVLSASNTFTNCTKLIDIVIGAAMVASFSLATWSPTEALLNNSQTLLTPEDIAAGFTSNLQKLLYNIREHIAANLPVAPNTITFSAAVKAAILADQPTADAFTNRGWTIA